MIQEIEIKKHVKEALFEFFTEDNNYLRDVVYDVMEDIALGKAIEKGDSGDYVTEDDIIAVLKKDISK